MAVTWIAAAALSAMILALILAPAMEVRLTRRIVNPVLVAALLLAIGLFLGNAIPFTHTVEFIAFLGVASGLLVAFGLFFTVLACARFALAEGPPPPTAGAPPERQPPSAL